ncbi:MAG: ABC transporter permease [Gemmatimonadota bacterium]|nr:MAG: ABC transporter permease [Gemmatimonadota bacterium]
MASLWHDMKLSVRMLRRDPGFATVAVLTLALGIGGTSAIFSVVNGVLLRPFPYANPSRLVVVWERKVGGLPYMFASPPNYADWRDDNQVFDNMGAFTRRRLTLQGETESFVIRGADVTADMFSTLGARPLMGRLFTADDDRDGSEPVVLLSYDFWHRRFGGDPAVVGTSILLNEQSHAVIGVLPPDFDFPPPIVLEGAIPNEDTEVWRPLAMDLGNMSRGAHFLTVIARLKDGFDVDRATAEMNTLARRLQLEYPESNSGWEVTITPLDRQVLGDIRIQLLILLGAVAIVLLIACVNVANLLLARGTTRLREFAVRSSLGAGRRRLLRQLLTESLGLSLVGGIIGLALAVWGANLLIQMAPQDIPRLDQVGLDGRVVGFTLLVTIVTGALFGLAPAFQGAAENLSERLREGGRGQAEGRASSRLRSGLVVAEVALSLVLLVGAGLLFQSFLRLRNIDTGFQAANRLTLRLTPPVSRYPAAPNLIAAYAGLETRLNAIPGVSAAGFVSEVPLAADRGGTSFTFEGEVEPPPDENRTINFAIVTPNYFRAMGVNLLQGRYFTEHDGPTGEPVVIINDAFVRRHFPNEDPIGKVLVIHDYTLRIVGVVAGVRHAGLRIDPNPSVYVAYSQIPFSRSMSLVMLSETRADAALGTVREAIRQFDPGLPLYDVKTMEQVMSESLARMRFSTLLMALFSIVAVLLATIGIYGVISYSVSRRTREIGVRVAIGARSEDILRLVLKQGMRLVGIGVVVGSVAALGFSRFLNVLLYRVDVKDMVTLAGVALLLVLVALLACYLPARRAMKIEPIEALRYE